MKLLHIHIIAAKSCGGLLDGFKVNFRNQAEVITGFSPLCLIGPNGTGKSQFLQVLAEIFQLAWNACSPSEERIVSNPELQFEIEYLMSLPRHSKPVHVRLTHKANASKTIVLLIDRRNVDSIEWTVCDVSVQGTAQLLPQKVVAYTSGGNETLSLPFLVSRSGYAKDVTEEAFRRSSDGRKVPDTRLMLVDYGTHLEVLVANLLLGNQNIRNALLKVAPVRNLHSFRCIVQLARPTYSRLKVLGSKRKGIQITDELESYLDHLTRSATCHSYDEKTETYIFDFFVDAQVRVAFSSFWSETLRLYSSFHKFSMLNDLAIPKATRERFKKQAKTRRFASRLAEPQDEEKVFRFERVCFSPKEHGEPVDYVSLSDGEHQLAQILGTMAMTSFANVLFLLDEPESHFNPQWRVNFISQLLDLPTENGTRRTQSKAGQQECLLTTHAPFVPSDMHRESVLIFSKDPDGKIKVSTPNIETFGTTYDSILDDCFGVRPPISNESRQEIGTLMKSKNSNKIRKGMETLGNSVEKAFLADRVEQLTPKTKKKK